MNINSSSNYGYSSQYQIDSSKVQRVDALQKGVSLQSEEEIQKHKDMLKSAEELLTAIDNGSVLAANAPENLYAEINVNGEVVAKVWKNGSMYISDKYAGLLSSVKDGNTAQERTNLLSKALGGTVNYSARVSPSYDFSQSLQQIISSYR